MQNGDLANESPRRLLVTWEAITEERSRARKMFGFPLGVEVTRVIHKPTVNLIWRAAERLPVVFELVCYGADEDECERREEMLEARGMNPFRWVNGYDSLESLRDELPQRLDVIGIIDEPDNYGRYGSAGTDLDYLARLI